MEKLLLNASEVFMKIALFVGVPASLLGVLLVLGFKNKSKTALLITVIGLIGLGFFGLGLNLEGLVTGKALTLSKFGPTTVSKFNDPVYYYFAINIWIFVSIIFIGLMIWLIRKILNR